MESKKEWRCPYCDALNDWQDRVCQICGDGTRDEQGEPKEEIKVDMVETEVFQGKQYTDQERETHSTQQMENAAVQEHSEIQTDCRKQKRRSLHPAGCVLSALAVAAMIYTYMAGNVAEDMPSQTVWFGLMATICLINVIALLVKKPVVVGVCLILKYLTDAIGVFIILSTGILFYPNSRNILANNDIVLFLTTFCVPALNCWLTFRRENKKH